MHLDLTEILACPVCGPGYGLVAVVDDMEGGRIVSGSLGCPNCERRHEIRGGMVHMAGSSPPAGGAGDEGDMSEERVEIVQALCGVPPGPELLLFGDRLGRLAAEVCLRRTSATVLAVCREPAATHAPVLWIVPASDPALPLRDGRFRAAVLEAPSAAEVREAVRVLAPRGRLVVLSPGGEAEAALPELPLEPLASDSRAWVGARL